MGLFDQHLHSWHSFDSATDPRENVESALARGLSGLTFTDHYDVHPEDWKDCRYDEASVRETIDALRDEYQERIFIGKGIEVCYQPEQMDDVVGFLRTHEYDLVMLSVHYFTSHAVHRREFWKNRTTGEVVEAYLQTVLEAVRWCTRLHRDSIAVFHVLGHLDLVKRYAVRFRQGFDLAPFDNLIRDILEACLECGLVPEINTSGLRQNVGEAMPGPGVVRMYASLGGTAMSLGSDAHRAEDIAADFDVAGSMLQDAGIFNIATFQRGKRIDLALV